MLLAAFQNSIPDRSGRENAAAGRVCAGEYVQWSWRAVRHTMTDRRCSKGVDTCKATCLAQALTESSSRL